MLQDILSKVASSRLLRRIALPMLERFNPGDVRIRHHYTRRALLLHSYRHKGYWFHGLRREQETMRFFQQVLRPGDTVVEVGGHIGYLTMWFAELVGKTGRVIVFEPGRNNLPYLRANVTGANHVEIVESAVSDTDGVASFFEEELTGQNNSLLGDYERFTKNRELAFSKQSYRERQVKTVRLDTVLRDRSIEADLVKIDIEGAEYMALSGAAELLVEQRPMLMVEVTNRSAEVFSLLRRFGYQLFAPSGGPLPEEVKFDGNVCALHPEQHVERLERWIGTDSHAA